MNRSEELQAYVVELFAAEDAVLAEIRREHRDAGLPDIAISAEEGRVLQVLLRAAGARRVLEVGTLGGYSGVWIARALGAGGKLTTIEINPEFARMARRSFEKAGVSDRVEVLEGRALDILPFLEPGFDAIFLDADKEPLVDYYRASLDLLRLGGLLLCDNAFFNGRVVDLTDTRPDIEGVRAFNRMAATDPRLLATVLPVRDGLLVGVKVAE
ncbi:MAG: O-methyltransferase [Gemmatimonadales bacterium]|nr:Putative O-methyltransferase [bacterium HR33]GIW51771.1 MAG: O-methyltransferase [Gemmatimonadales bacterium]